MTNDHFKIDYTKRTINSAIDVETPLLSLVWKVTQRCSKEINDLKMKYNSVLNNLNTAWIVLADEHFRLNKLYHTFKIEVGDDSDFYQLVNNLYLEIQRIEQELKAQDISVEAPEQCPYTPDLAELFESVMQIPQPGIKEPIIKEVLVPIIKRANQVIRLGKAIIAIPE